MADELSDEARRQIEEILKGKNLGKQPRKRNREKPPILLEDKLINSFIQEHDPDAAIRIAVKALNRARLAMLMVLRLSNEVCDTFALMMGEEFQKKEGQKLAREMRRDLFKDARRALKRLYGVDCERP